MYICVLSFHMQATPVEEALQSRETVCIYAYIICTLILYVCIHVCSLILCAGHTSRRGVGKVAKLFFHDSLHPPAGDSYNSKYLYNDNMVYIICFLIQYIWCVFMMYI